MQFNPSPNWAEVARWCRNVSSAVALAAPILPMVQNIPTAGPVLAVGTFIVGTIAKDVLAFLTANNLDTQGPK